MFCMSLPEPTFIVTWTLKNALQINLNEIKGHKHIKTHSHDRIDSWRRLVSCHFMHCNCHLIGILGTSKYGTSRIATSIKWKKKNKKQNKQKTNKQQKPIASEKWDISQGTRSIWTINFIFFDFDCTMFSCYITWHVFYISHRITWLLNCSTITQLVSFQGWSTAIVTFKLKHE